MENSKISTGKRLVKNTIYMYIRMFFLLLINFYTSRVLLQQLGVEDFGTYNLVASIIIMFASLRLLIASSTQRFLNYDMGKGNNDRLQIIFNMSIYINLCIALIFFIIIESVGIWFFAYKINIDPSRLQAAFLVFQCSIVSSLISIFTTSYDATIIAHEKMDFLAIASLLDATLKLGAVFLLPIIPFDKLALYGILLMVISCITFIINFIYCRIHFAETKFKKVWDKALFYEMIGFAGWNFLGKFAATATQSGLNMILNIFGGPIVNAARGIAFSLNSATNQFVNNINIVLDPFFIKTYASKDFHKFYMTFNFTSKVLYFVQILLVIPFYFFSEEILKFWLGQVPEYSVLFLRLILIWSLIRAPHSPIDKLFKAVGNIMYYQIIEGIILALPLLTSYIFLKSGFDYSTIFFSMIVFEAINLFIILLLAKKQCKFPLKSYFSSVFLPNIIFSLPLICGIFIIKYIRIDILSTFILVATIEILTLLLFVCFLNSDEKNQIYIIVKRKKYE